MNEYDDATQLIVQAADLMASAKTLQTTIDERTAQFHSDAARREAEFQQEIAADKSKVKDLQLDAKSKMQRAAKLMGPNREALDGAPRTADYELVFDYIEQHPGTNAARISKDLNFTLNSVRAAIALLQGQRKIDVQGSNRGRRISVKE